MNASRILVQANACYDNTNGIGLFSRSDLRDPGGHAIGPNMLYRNEHDLVQGGFGNAQRAIPRVRLYGMHGAFNPELVLMANPGTLFEWHDARERSGALFVKARGSGTDGWVLVSTEPARPGRPPRPPIKPT